MIDDARATVDLLVIGGGVNGCGIARDAAGRGLSVLLCEQGDLAGATSSASSKLIHGGLRYLEHRAFRLVRESLAEREILLRAAPHLIRALRFILPHHAGLRPAWFLRLGLFLYDRLGGRSVLPGAAAVALAPPPLKPIFSRGFAYSDAWTDDARMVVLTALDAAERGAQVLTRARFLSAQREGGRWRARIREADGGIIEVSARALVNAAGPWVSEVAGLIAGAPAPRPIRLVKGSHIVVPRLYAGEHAYTLQGGDGRVVFAIPYEDRFTLVGTTDVPVDAPGDATASPEEIAYLCRSLGDYFLRPVLPAHVVWSFAGVRPLLDTGEAAASAVSRDYALDLDGGEGAAPLLTVLGGKLTTFRRLSEQSLERLRPHLGFSAGPWTAHAPLPGGDFDGGFETFRAGIGARFPWLEESQLTRLCRAYGTRVARVIGDAGCLAEMGCDFGAGLTAREVDYLRREEWAVSPEDVLWRRTKLGLHMTSEQRASFARMFDAPAAADVAEP